MDILNLELFDFIQAVFVKLPRGVFLLNTVWTNVIAAILDHIIFYNFDTN
jgi:hypothetical protein